MIYLKEIKTEINSSKKARKLFTWLLSQEMYDDAVLLLVMDYDDTYFSLNEKKRFLSYLRDNVPDNLDPDYTGLCRKEFLNSFIKDEIISNDMDGYKLLRMRTDEYHLYIKERRNKTKSFNSLISVSLSSRDLPRIRNFKIINNIINEISEDSYLIDIKNRYLLGFITCMHNSSYVNKAYDNKNFFINFFKALAASTTDPLLEAVGKFSKVFEPKNAYKHVVDIANAVFEEFDSFDVINSFRNATGGWFSPFHEYFVEEHFRRLRRPDMGLLRISALEGGQSGN